MRTVWLVVLAVACSEYDVKAEADGATPADTATTPAAPGVLLVTPAELDFGLREVDTTTDEVILIELLDRPPKVECKMLCIWFTEDSYQMVVSRMLRISLHSWP